MNEGELLFIHTFFVFTGFLRLSHSWGKERRWYAKRTRSTSGLVRDRATVVSKPGGVRGAPVSYLAQGGLLNWA